jgi:hypothetical protein
LIRTDARKAKPNLGISIMKTAQLLTLLTFGATMILAPGSERIAYADRDSHPVFKENPGKHKGWDKDKKDKDDKHYHPAAEARSEHRHKHFADAGHEHQHARTVTRTSTGYWHRHDGYPRHFHYYRPAPRVAPHQHVRRDAVVFDNRGHHSKPEIRQDFTDVRNARKEVQQGRVELRKDYTELR